MGLQYPEEGNPGIGGTEYCYLMLAKYLIISGLNVEVIIYHYHNSNKLPNNVKDVIIQSDEECISNCKNDGVDFILFCTEHGEKWYELLKEYEQSAILWAHCFVSPEELRWASTSQYIRRVVFVGRQMYDMYIDHDIIKKSTYIFNMFHVKESNERMKLDHNVIYIGSLVQGKGFDYLAKIWKNILEKVPDAQLYVIGSGKLYRRDSKLGKFNLAEEAFEQKFMPHLINKNEEIDNSVHFLGLLGSEKEYYIKRATVGVINPSARTETFGISGVEFEACGVPVVTKGSLGLLDTIINKKTGLLHNNEKEFTKNLVTLLTDSELNSRLGANAKLFVAESFEPKVLIQNWINLFISTYQNSPVIYQPPVNYWMKNNKWIRGINRFLRFNLKLKFIPSYVELEQWLRSLKR
jgi:Glycosyltransferase